MGRPVALPTITDDSALGGTVIEKSVRFHDADGAHFRRDASSTGNRRTWTFSCWVKRMDLGAYRSMFGCLLYTSPSPRDGLLSRMPSSA